MGYQVGSVARRTSRAVAVSYRFRGGNELADLSSSVACIVYQLPTDAELYE